MNYAVPFALLSATFAAFATQGGWWLLLLWPSYSLLLLAICYAGAGPRIFGKQPNGAISSLSVIQLLPYLSATWIIWHLLRITQREDGCNCVTPQLWIGRRLLAGEMPAEIHLVVDLTTEFVERCKAVEYLSFPILDGMPPDLRTFEQHVAYVAACESPTYIHCASGHGRSALFLTAVLLRKGVVSTIDEGLEKIRSVRPAIGLSKQQRIFLEGWVKH